jgi:hypothetical protein
LVVELSFVLFNAVLFVAIALFFPFPVLLFVLF